MADKTELQLALVGLLSKPTTQGMLLTMFIAPLVLVGIIFYQYGIVGISVLDEIRKNTTEISIGLRELRQSVLVSSRK